MIVIFAKDRKISSLAIRLFTWSRYHHCGALTSDGEHVIEATAKHGVIKTPLAEFNSRYRETRLAEIECDDAKAQRFLAVQISKKYDWLAVISIFFRLKYQRPNKWFCSELVAGACGAFRSNRGARITPEHLWAISKDLG